MDPNQDYLLLGLSDQHKPSPGEPRSVLIGIDAELWLIPQFGPMKFLDRTRTDNLGQALFMDVHYGLFIIRIPSLGIERMIFKKAMSGPLVVNVVPGQASRELTESFVVD